MPCMCVNLLQLGRAVALVSFVITMLIDSLIQDLLCYCIGYCSYLQLQAKPNPTLIHMLPLIHIMPLSARPSHCSIVRSCIRHLWYKRVAVTLMTLKDI